MGLTFFKKTKISKLFLLKLAFMNIAKSPKKRMGKRYRSNTTKNENTQEKCEKIIHIIRRHFLFSILKLVVPLQIKSIMNVGQALG